MSVRPQEPPRQAAGGLFGVSKCTATATLGPGFHYVTGVMFAVCSIFFREEIHILAVNLDLEIFLIRSRSIS